MRKLLMTTGVILAVLVATTIQSSAQTEVEVINGCVNNKTGVLRISDKCTKSETPISWNQTGPKGDTGETGPTGPPGPGVDGITRVVHGIVGWNGDVISGTGFQIPDDIMCFPTYACQTLVKFNEPFISLPTCTASTYPSSTGDYVTAVIISVVISEDSVTVRYQQPIPEYPYSGWTRSGFTFICVE